MVSTPWRIGAASVMGTRHSQNNLPCQDAHCWEILSSEVLVMAIADGAGSASRAAQGSQLAVTQALERLKSELREQFPANELSWRKASLKILKQLRTDFKAQANQEGGSLDDLSTTLIFGVMTPQLVAVTQVGDGAAILQDALGRLKALTLPPQEDPSLEITTFLTSPSALKSAQFTYHWGRHARLALLTDGLQLLALKLPQGEPHEPFFKPLFRYIAQSQNPTEASEEIAKFLNSERVRDRVDDDLTLFLASQS
ncbi:MAG: PP2C family serine/threonine-protein phosphatase [Cyanobacteria bacterium P01_H01_bin.15]